MTYNALLLDYDGVLVRILDSERRFHAFRQRAETVFQTDHVELDSDLVETLSGSVTHNRLLTMSESLGVDPERLWRYRDDTLAAVLKDAIRDGTKEPYEDVRALSDIDVHLGIASNNQQRVVEFSVERHDLQGRFETIRAREPKLKSLQRKKPAPTYLQQATDDLGATNPLYVGDKETDVVAGTRAEIDTALIRREHNAERTIEHEPTYEVESLDEIVALLQQSR